MIHTDFRNGINPTQVLAETLAAIASMPISNQQEMARIVLNYDKSLLLESLLPNIIAELTADERKELIGFAKL